MYKVKFIIVFDLLPAKPSLVNWLAKDIQI